jgi:hypothetical protein
MNFNDLFNLIGTNMSVWGVFFLIGTGIWMLALSRFDKKISKK